MLYLLSTWVSPLFLTRPQPTMNVMQLVQNIPKNAEISNAKMQDQMPKTPNNPCRLINAQIYTAVYIRLYRPL
ncbi:hypothetical protein F5144DRAFT_126351 [Chaetomium tenue]|uniref:Uncharacterized protein n=1 Tax=Chaetomium tenue TaxID=1854479 RepID=A0ACB7PH30_9PEZI|nr:hypothetical protein F5144DRAFT_126351 [Chaetomium globosum]